MTVCPRAKTTEDRKSTGIPHDFFKWSLCLEGDDEASASSCELTVKMQTLMDKRRTEKAEHNVTVPRYCPCESTGLSQII